MIKELAFTPHIFDEETNSANSKWHEQIRVLGEKMFPWCSPTPFVVSNLGEGGWDCQVNTYVGAIKTNTKYLVQSLILQMKNIMVKHPLWGDWPGDNEIEWANQALKISENKFCPIERIVTTDAIALSMKNVYALNDITGSGFWNGLAPNNTLPMVISDQVKRLQILCVHAKYISISSAYLNDGKSDESDFVFALIQNIDSSTIHKERVHFDVHCQASSGLIKQDSPEVLNLIGKFKKYAKYKVQIQLNFWDKIRERILLAGEKTAVSGETKMKVRWGISMQHIARATDVNQNDQTYWILLTPQSIYYWYNYFYQRKPILGPLLVT
jgi:hypothetical protein